MGNIALQIERLATGAAAAADAVVFDHIVYSSGDIAYDMESGAITFHTPGRYLITWSVSIQTAASNALIFALSSSQSDFLQGNLPLRNGEVSGSAIIDATDVPVTVSLVNSGGNAFYAANVPVRANLVVVMDENSGNTAGSSYCFSMAQLAHIVEQLITLYPASVMSVFTTNLNTITGTPYQLYASATENSGQHIAIPLKAITAIYTGDDTVYNPAISYLIPTAPLPKGCDTDLMTAVYDYLPLLTEVILRMGVTVQASGAIYRNEYGLLVLSDAAGSTPIFVPVFNLATIITDITDASAAGSAAKQGTQLTITNKLQ